MKSKIRNTILVLVLLCSSIAEAESTKNIDYDYGTPRGYEEQIYLQ